MDAPLTDDKIAFKLEVFEGPLELLLHLLKKNKVSILDIPIVKITGQFIQYLVDCKKFDIELSSDFLVMASELLMIKSKMLLPKPEEEKEDPRQDLVDRLLQYERMKKLSQFLKENEFSTRYNYFKEPEYIESKPADYSGQMFDLDILISAFLDIADKAERKTPPPKSAFKAIVPHEIVPVEGRVKYIREKLKIGKKVKFEKLFSGIESRPVLVATFLALLEMIKGQFIIAETVNNNIFITKLKDGEYEHEPQVRFDN
ncbi:MAG: segregation/condensation protein A [Ruminococcaceae bacterium]|nr:segregation/condensation protein A [Oscillospiraceae bacterium]